MHFRIVNETPFLPLLDFREKAWMQAKAYPVGTR